MELLATSASGLHVQLGGVCMGRQTDNRISYIRKPMAEHGYLCLGLAGVGLLPVSYTHLFRVQYRVCDGQSVSGNRRRETICGRVQRIRPRYLCTGKDF